MYNFGIANQRSSNPVKIHYLLPFCEKEERVKIKGVMSFLGVVHFCPQSLDYIGEYGRLIEEHYQESWGLERHLFSSFQYFAGLLKAQSMIGQEFDIIEFPDFGGVGFVSLSAKQSGLAFQKSQISVRLHSTLGLIMRAEPFYHTPSEWMAGVFDLERKTIEDADIIISHLPCIAKLNQRLYNFSDGWLEKVQTEFPPILLDEKQIDQQNIKEEFRKPKNFIFSSRIQPFKRPDLFIRAAVHFLGKNPSYDGQFFIVSYGWDQKYISWLNSLIPKQWKESIVFLFQLSTQARLSLLRSSIVVIPSDYESLCLFAYESVLLNSKVILNRSCEAFGDCTRWIDRRNCLLFDGTFIDLSRVMQEALFWEPDMSVDVKIDIPYWEKTLVPTVTTNGLDSDSQSISIVIYGGQDIAAFSRKVHELLQLTDVIINIHVVVPHSILDSQSFVSLESKGNIIIHNCNWNEPTATEINLLIAKIQTTYVCLLHTDTQLQPIFFKLACTALARYSEFSIFTSNVLIISKESTDNYLGNKDKAGFSVVQTKLYGGNLPSIALMTNKLAHQASIMRTTVAQKYQFKEEAIDRWFEEFVARYVLAGERVIVCPIPFIEELKQSFESEIASEKFYATIFDQFGIEYSSIASLHNGGCA